MRNSKAFAGRRDKKKVEKVTKNFQCKIHLLVCLRFRTRVKLILITFGQKLSLNAMRILAKFNVAWSLLFLPFCSAYGGEWWKLFSGFCTEGSFSRERDTGNFHSASESLDSIFMFSCIRCSRSLGLVQEREERYESVGSSYSLSLPSRETVQINHGIWKKNKVVSTTFEFESRSRREMENGEKCSRVKYARSQMLIKM